MNRENSIPGAILVHEPATIRVLPVPVHALTPRGGWTPDGSWVPVPFVDERCAELLFRKKVLELLKDEGLLSEEREQLPPDHLRIRFFGQVHLGSSGSGA